MDEFIEKLKTTYFRTASFAKVNLDTVYVFLVSDDEINRRTVDIIPEFCSAKGYKKAILMGEMTDYKSQYEYANVSKEYIQYLLILQRAFHPFRNILMNTSSGYDDWDYYSFADEYGLDKEYLIREVVFDLYSPNKNKMIPILPANKQPKTEWDSIRDRIEKATIDYEEIRKLYRDTFLFLQPYASGDMYMSCLYLDNYIKRQSISSYKVICANNSSRKVGELFGFNPIMEDREKLLNVILYGRVVGFDGLEMKNTHAYPVNSRGYHVWHKLDFNTYVKHWVFQSEKRIVTPKLSQEDSLYLFEQKNLVLDKTILISPVSHSVEPIKDKIYEKVVEKLNNKGYVVCTNVCGDEKPLPGTIGVQIPYSCVIDFVNKCAGFIGMRSGLCDVISSTSSKMVVYHREFCFNQFSLERMGLKTDNILELCIDTLSEEDVVEKTIEAIIYGKE